MPSDGEKFKHLNKTSQECETALKSHFTYCSCWYWSLSGGCLWSQSCGWGQPWGSYRKTKSQIKERLLIRKSMWCKWVWKHFALKWVSKHLWDVVKKLRICFLSAQSKIPTTFDVGSVREQATKNSEWNQMNPMCVIEKAKHGTYALWQLKYFTNLKHFKVFPEFKLWSRVLWLQWFNIGGAALCGLFIDCENVFDTKIAKSP